MIINLGYKAEVEIPEDVWEYLDSSIFLMERHSETMGRLARECAVDSRGGDSGQDNYDRIIEWATYPTKHEALGFECAVNTYIQEVRKEMQDEQLHSDTEET